MNTKAVVTTPPAIIPPVTITVTLTMNYREASLLRTIAGANHRIPNLLFGGQKLDLMTEPTASQAREVVEVLNSIGYALSDVNVDTVRTI